MSARKSFGAKYLENNSDEEDNNSDDQSTTYSFSSPKDQKCSPSVNVRRVSKLRTNRNGLPVEVQRALLANVLNFQGLDNFARDTCDGNTVIFGKRSSPRRTACQAKHRHFLDIYNSSPSEFLKLCNCFAIAVQDNKLVLRGKLENEGKEFSEKSPTLERVKKNQVPSQASR